MYARPLQLVFQKINSTIIQIGSFYVTRTGLILNAYSQKIFGLYWGDVSFRKFLQFCYLYVEH